MASRTRGVNRHLPPHLSDLLHSLSENGRLFIQLYECNKERMQAVARELAEISEEVKAMQDGANTNRMIGATVGGLGIAAGVAAAYFAVGSSAGDKAVHMAAAALGCTFAFIGGASVISANVIKAKDEKICTETVEKLGKEFMEVVELLKDVLEGIKTVSEALEEKSSALKTTTGEQAERGLMNTKQLQQFLKQTPELAERSRKVLDATLSTEKGVRELLNVVTRISPTPEEDAELRNCIAGSASQCEKTLTEFAKMRNTLRDFEEI